MKKTVLRKNCFTFTKDAPRKKVDFLVRSLKLQLYFYIFSSKFNGSRLRFDSEAGINAVSSPFQRVFFRTALYN